MEEQEPDAAEEPEEDLPDFDYAAPLKDDDELPGLDPVITIPPE